MIVVLVGRALRVRRLAERDQRRAGVRADDPADVEVAERPLRRVTGRRVGAEHPAPFRPTARRPSEERRAPPPRVACGRLERQRVTDVRQARRRGHRRAARASCAAVLRQRPVVVRRRRATRAGCVDLAEPAGEGLGGRDRTALAHVVAPGRSRARARGTRSRISGSRCERRPARTAGFFDQNSSTHASSPMLSIRSAEASMRGARFERSRLPPMQRRAPARRRAARARA